MKANIKVGFIITGALYLHHRNSVVSEMQRLGVDVVAEIDSLVQSDQKEARIKGAAEQLLSIIDPVLAYSPDLVVAPYDREEAITISLVATYLGFPIAHIGAGDRTGVNVDGIIRHAVTKMANIFFVACDESKKRVEKLGENKSLIFNVGHVGLDRYKEAKNISKQELSKFFDLDFFGDPIVVLLKHPVSEYSELSSEHMRITLEALDFSGLQVVIIKPNSDPGRYGMVNMIDNFHFSNASVSIFDTVPEIYFINLMKNAHALVGNSSMGVFEAPFLLLPVVNVGERQVDRYCGNNIIFVDHDSFQIRKAVMKALTDEKFHQEIRKDQYIYGNGTTADSISEILVNLDMSCQHNKTISY